MLSSKRCGQPSSAVCWFSFMVSGMGEGGEREETTLTLCPALRCYLLGSAI